MTERPRQTLGPVELMDCLTKRSPWGQIVVDGDQRIVLWNAWIEHASEIPAAVAIGEPLGAVFEQLSPRVVDAIEQSLRGGISTVLSRAFLPHPFPLRNRQFRDRPMFQSVTVSGFRGESAQPCCLINISDASSEVQRESVLRKHADDLQRSKAELEEVNHDLEMFTQMVGHDLRAPLRGIRSFCNFLKQDLGANVSQSVQRDLDSIDLATGRLGGLIDAIYRLAQSDRDSLQRERVAVGDMVDQVLMDVAAVAGWDEAVVTRDELPEIVVDRSLLERVLQNLLDNAIKYRGSKAARIHVSCERRRGEIVLAVRDHGIGVDPAKAEQMFAPFERALHDNVEGLGIGLAICRRVIERHGGRIWFEPVDDGACVRLALPDVAPA